eukprot:352382-Chlamydomonas_euryale.AAC.4
MREAGRRASACGWPAFIRPFRAAFGCDAGGEVERCYQRIIGNRGRCGWGGRALLSWLAVENGLMGTGCGVVWCGVMCVGGEGAAASAALTNEWMRTG